MRSSDLLREVELLKYDFSETAAVRKLELLTQLET